MAEEYKHIIRIVNTDLDGSKPIFRALTKIKGVSTMFSNAVCSISGIDRTIKAGNLTDKQAAAIEDVIKNPLKHNMPAWLFNRRKDPETGESKHILSGDIGFIQSNDIKMMKKTKSYKGLRHQWGLTVRGQKTKSNFRRNKGKVTLGVKRKKVKSGK